VRSQTLPQVEKIDDTQLERLASQIALAPGEHEFIPVVSPSTGAVFSQLPLGKAADVDLAVYNARAAQPEWAGRSFRERRRIFLRFHDLLLARQHEVLDLIQIETGKARRHAFEEILDTAVTTRYYANHAQRLLRPRRRRGALPALTKTWELRSPVGVVGFIVPWNYPLNLAITDVVPALMAGNTAVLKPDVQTSFTALWALRLLREAGLPPAVFSIVTGEGPIVGPALGERVDFLMFTGSTRTGRLVAARAGERLIGCSLELGGKNPMIVLADADLEETVDGAVRGSFACAGQVCVSVERIYVHESIFEPFLNRFAERTKALKLGAALDFSADMGCLTSQPQLDKIEEHVRDAVSKGAKVAAGARRRPDLGPFFYEPTILTNVREGMKVYTEETFGPVVSVFAYQTEEEAMDLANRTAYGLNASVWTRNHARGIAIARRIRAGSVNINDVYAAAWGSVDSPIGGMKESGQGRRHGAEGILKFTEPQTIAIQRLLPIAPSHGMTPEFFARWMTRLLKLMRPV
jgi:acyl-CoA reductase-like NAD-dependent aldehyde dehydrogenase